MTDHVIRPAYSLASLLNEEIIKNQTTWSPEEQEMRIKLLQVAREMFPENSINSIVDIAIRIERYVINGS